MRNNFTNALTEHTGKTHNHLGIDLDYYKKGKFKVPMIKYLHKILTGFLEHGKLDDSVATPYLDHLFQVRDKKVAPIRGNVSGVPPCGGSVTFPM